MAILCKLLFVVVYALFVAGLVWMSGRDPGMELTFRRGRPYWIAGWRDWVKATAIVVLPVLLFCWQVALVMATVSVVIFIVYPPARIAWRVKQLKREG